MELIRTVAEMADWRRAAEGSVGLVPTMGAIHQGHLALARRARAECATVAASLFVNPLQFGEGEDLERYPRSFKADLDLLEREGADCVFAPTAEEMYPGGKHVTVAAGALGDTLEGQRRPRHFVGVATVVVKLLNLVMPDRAYFGQKDAQQLAVVCALVRELLLAPQIVAVPTVREADGVACSSRNAYLSGAEREAARVIYRGLQAMEAAWRRGVRNSGALQRIFTAMVAEEPVLRSDYVAVVNPVSFEPLQLAEEGSLIVAAVYAGETRLLDCLSLE